MKRNNNKWGKWYLSEDGKTFECLVGQWVKMSIPVSKCETKEMQEKELNRIFSRNGEWKAGALKKSGYDLHGLKAAFADTFRGI